MFASRILIVDDQEPIVHLVCSILSQCGFEAVGATDVERALEIIRAGPPVDLVISDFEMPLMQGPELLEAVRTLSPSTGLMLMSGGWTGVCLQRIAFLQKPFTAQELLAAVEASLLVFGGACTDAGRLESTD